MRAAPTAPSPSLVQRVALAGNPNVGKTTIFNLLTGLRQKVGNYPGVTVERKTGRLIGSQHVEIVDLPGTYSLNPRSLDEEIAYRALTGRIDGEPPPDLVACVVDATNLERNLYLVSQIADLGLPIVILLNMMDVTEREGLRLDVKLLSEEMGLPVFPVSAAQEAGFEPVREALSRPAALPRRRWRPAAVVLDEIDGLAEIMAAVAPDVDSHRRFGEVLRALVNDRILALWKGSHPGFHAAVVAARDRLELQGISIREAEAAGRFAWLGPLVERVSSREKEEPEVSLTDRLDSVLAHPKFGPLAFLFILFLIFQAVFSWAVPAMDLIDAGIGALGGWIGSNMPPGDLRSLLVDGVVAGVGAVLVFLPQILLLFFFVGLLEDTGYMARAAFISDRHMNRLGLSGRSVVPLVSGYACAVPAIMATRTIDNHRDRIVTMMVIPLMSCSARLPIYTLFIAAFIPQERLLGLVGYQGLTLFALYLLSTVLALTAALVLRKNVFPGMMSLLVMELPPYRVPRMKQVAWQLYGRGRVFVTRAGKVILLMSILLWFLASYPKVGEGPDLDAGALHGAEDRGGSGSLGGAAAGGGADLGGGAAAGGGADLGGGAEAVDPGRQIRGSFIGTIGHFIEPVMRPLGFDWKISASIIAAFAAREVLISTLSTIYSVGDADDSGLTLQARLKADRYPDTGEPVFTTLVAVSLMIFFMLACQCMSTLAITRRETNTWRWPIFMWTYMMVLAYVASFIVYQGGRLLGLG